MNTKIQIQNCPCCDFNKFQPLFHFLEIPQSGIFLENDSLSKITKYDLLFELCLICGILRQITVTKPKNYIDVNRSTALQFPKYIDQLIESIKDSNIKFDDFIVEIGSNDGLFIEALKNHGFKNILGIEPSKELYNVSTKKGLSILNNFFSETLASQILNNYGAPKLVICRHTLEHVPDPRSFVSSIRKSFGDKDGILLLEVPDGSAIPEFLNIYELWDEHLFYFFPNNLTRLLELSGFKVNKLEQVPHLDTRNIISWSSISQNILNPFDITESDVRCVNQWKNLKIRWDNLVNNLIIKVKKIPRPIFVIGASHSQTNFINFSGLYNFVDFLIDDDSFKSGKFAALKKNPKKIISTKEFEAINTEGSIIKTGFGYKKWTARLCIHAQKNNMEILDPKNLIS